MKVWLILIISSLAFGFICGLKIKNIVIGTIISIIVPITVFSSLIMYQEFFMPYQGGGASMWPIAILVGGTAASFFGLIGFLITKLISKILLSSSNKSSMDSSVKHGTPPVGGAP